MADDVDTVAFEPNRDAEFAEALVEANYPKNVKQCGSTFLHRKFCLPAEFTPAAVASLLEQLLNDEERYKQYHRVREQALFDRGFGVRVMHSMSNLPFDDESWEGIARDGFRSLPPEELARFAICVGCVWGWVEAIDKMIDEGDERLGQWYCDALKQYAPEFFADA